MAFRGKHLVRSKREIDGTVLGKVKQFNFLRCELSLEGERRFDNKQTVSKEYAALLENI
jgi:hypothetical protein